MHTMQVRFDEQLFPGVTPIEEKEKNDDQDAGSEMELSVHSTSVSDGEQDQPPNPEAQEKIRLTHKSLLTHHR